MDLKFSWILIIIGIILIASAVLLFGARDLNPIVSTFVNLSCPDSSDALKWLDCVSIAHMRGTVISVLVGIVILGAGILLKDKNQKRQ